MDFQKLNLKINLQKINLIVDFILSSQFRDSQMGNIVKMLVDFIENVHSTSENLKWYLWELIEIKLKIPKKISG